MSLAFLRREGEAGGGRGPALGALSYSDRRGWVVWAGCESCGGYALELRVHDRAAAELARARAEAFLARVHEQSCLGCQARSWRTRMVPPGRGPYVWWDTESGEWMAWRSLPGSPAGVSLPLGVRTFWAPHEVRAAARALWSDSPLPLRVACDPSDVDGEASWLFHDRASGRWRLRVACFDCDGFDLPLMSFGRVAIEGACDEALACLELVAREGCPGCRSAAERDGVGRGDGEPRLWFDPDAGDWLLWQAVDGDDSGVTLPLGIGRFDVARAVVHQKAAPLLFGSGLLPDDSP
jgi:hypothetical protein